MEEQWVGTWMYEQIACWKWARWKTKDGVSSEILTNLFDFDMEPLSKN